MLDLDAVNTPSFSSLKSKWVTAPDFLFSNWMCKVFVEVLRGEQKSFVETSKFGKALTSIYKSKNLHAWDAAI